MPPTTLEHFILFFTDSVGLERIIRLLQAVVQILLHSPFAFRVLSDGLDLVANQPPSPATTRSVLRSLHHHFGLVRRHFRFFRFIESFHAAHRLYLGITHTPRSTNTGTATPSWVQAEAWTDVFGRTFNGMYLLLEATTMLDAMKIDGLQLLGPKWERIMFLESQRFWAFALACGAFSGLLKMLWVIVDTPIPAGDGREPAKDDTSGNKKAETGLSLRDQLQRAGCMARSKEKEHILWMQTVCPRLRVLGRGVVANLLDMMLPGVALGWIDVGMGFVGLVMLLSTILTGMDAWERVAGREP